jgi:drug/metabolite transporter (DMT)-like permease
LAYTTIVNEVIKWLGRVGALVAFIGAVMLALSIKNNDAEQKQPAILTLVAGVLVAVVCGLADQFGLFT